MSVRIDPPLGGRIAPHTGAQPAKAAKTPVASTDLDQKEKAPSATIGGARPIGYQTGPTGILHPVGFTGWPETM
jgi:hypothetical protein